MAEAPEHHVPPGTYLAILGSLMALLAVTMVMAFVDLDKWTTAHHLGSGWNTAIAVGIAVLKGLLILLIFMHLKFGSRLSWVFAAAGFAWLMIMMWLTMTDYLSRQSLPGPRIEQQQTTAELPERENR